MKNLLIPIFVLAQASWSNFVTVGPGQPYSTILDGINSMLPLEEDLVVYCVVPSMVYSGPHVITPAPNWNGFKVEILGIKRIPKVTAYGEEGKIFEPDGTGALAFSYETVDGASGAEGRTNGTRMYAFIKDRLGSTRSTLSDEGTVVEAQMYSSYGNKTAIKASALKTREKFTGKERDNEGIPGEPGIDLDYFGARYYDSDLGLWISPDPLRQFASLYSYTGNGNNPVNGIDDDGKEFSPQAQQVYNIAARHKFWGSKTLESDLNRAKNSEKMFYVVWDGANGHKGITYSNLYWSELHLNPNHLTTDFAKVKTFRHELQHGEKMVGNEQDAEMNMDTHFNVSGIQRDNKLDFLGFLKWNSQQDNPDEVIQRDYQWIQEALDAGAATEADVNYDANSKMLEGL